MTSLPSATDFSTAPRTNESLSACGRTTPAASNKGSATLATECARPAMGSPFRTLLPLAVAVLKWCPRAVSAVSPPVLVAAPPNFRWHGPRPPPPPKNTSCLHSAPAAQNTKTTPSPPHPHTHFHPSPPP